MMRVIIEITETESVGNFSTSKTAHITIPLSSHDCDKEYSSEETIQEPTAKPCG